MKNDCPFTISTLTPVAACAAALCLSSGAIGQDRRDVGFVNSRVVELSVDSGPVSATGQASTTGSIPSVVFATQIDIPGAAWMRLVFDQLQLPGDGSTDRTAYLKLTSLSDGGTQYLNSATALQWQNTSAFFNGGSVRVEVWSMAGLAPAHVVISRAVASGVDAIEAPADLCGPDDRVPLSDNRSARLIGGTVTTPLYCSTFVFNDTNHFFLSAGHCNPTSASVVQFNVPPSTDLGQPQHPPPQDQYAVDPTSAQRSTVGVGNDWSYYGVFANSVTGLLPFQVYGLTHTFATVPPAVAGQTIRVNGSGTTDFPIPNARTNTLQTATGPYTLSSFTLRYNVDTTGGNSGSVVIDESTGLAIGIHYLAGCTTGGNQAVPCSNTNLRSAINNPLGVARSGLGTVSGLLYAIGDANNNFGTVNGPPARFAKIAQVGTGWQGMAWNARTGLFFACDSARRLFTVTPGPSANGGGVFTLLGTIGGAATGTTVINGLAFDARTNSLFGIAQATGQLYRISIDSMEAGPVATAIGTAQGGTVGGLDFDDGRNVLFGLDDHQFGTRLVRINTQTGVRTLVGSLGNDIRDANGLAWNATDGMLYTVAAGDDFLYVINPDTGAAARVGFTFGSFGASYGLATVNPLPCLLDFNHDGVISPDDLDDFITGYFEAPSVPEVDFNLDGMVSPDDLDAFVTAYFNGCM